MIGKIKHVHDTEAYLYMSNVLEGKQKVGSSVFKACERFNRDLLRDDLFFDLELARKVVNFPQLVNHWKGSMAGKSFKFNPHQAFSFQQMFGWKIENTGLRRFKRFAELVARKNGKTSEMAVMSMFHLEVDKEAGAQVYIGATKKDQAKLMLRDIGNFIKSSESKNDYKVYTNSGVPYKIDHYPSEGFLSVLGRDSDTEDGLDISMFLIDEWHAHKDSMVRDIGSSAMGNRLEPIEAIISTAGFNLNAPAYTKTRKVGLDILDQIKKDDEQLIMFFEMDDYDLWEDENEWECANPQLKYIPTLLPEIRSQLTKAKNEGGSTEVNFKTKHLNIWMNSAEGWLDFPTIRKNKHGISYDDLIGKDCYCGLDLSGGTDLNAFSLFFPNIKPGIHALKLMYWIPQEKIDRRKDDVDYYDWVQNGWVKVFDGNTVDYKIIAHDMVEEMNKYNVISIGVDPAYFSTGPASHLHESGYLERVEKVGQTYSNLTAPTTQIETWLSEGNMELFENPVLEWNFSNVTIALGTSSGKMPSKGKSVDKIDGVAAGIDAVFECLRLGMEPEQSQPQFAVLG